MSASVNSARTAQQTVPTLIGPPKAPTQSTKAAEIAETLGNCLGKAEDLKQKAKELLTLAKTETPKDPKFVITQILRVFSDDVTLGLESEAKYRLAEALHAYVDCVHLTTHEGMVTGDWKDAAANNLDAQVSLQEKHLTENALRYELRAAKAGINALKDNQERTKLFGFIIRLAQSAYAMDTGSLFALLVAVNQERKKTQAGFWYADLLLVRSLTSLAEKNDAIFYELIKMRDLHTTWKFQYGYIEALSQVLQKNPSSKHAETAFAIIAKKSSYRHWTNPDSWRIREVACKELILLTREDVFKEQAIQTLFNQSKKEEREEVKLRIASSIDTLESRDNWNDKYVVDLREDQQEIDSQLNEIEERRQEIEASKEQKSISEDEYAEEIKKLDEAKKSLEDQRKTINDLLLEIDQKVTEIKRMVEESGKKTDAIFLKIVASPTPAPEKSHVEKRFLPLIEDGITLTTADGLQRLVIDFTQVDQEEQVAHLSVWMNIIKMDKHPPEALVFKAVTPLDTDTLLRLIHPKLKQLTIIDCNSLQSVYLPSNVLLQWGWVQFPCLEVFHIEECEKLVSLYIDAPLLKQLNMINNPRLVTASLKARQDTIINRERSYKVRIELPLLDNVSSKPVLFSLAKQLEASTKEDRSESLAKVMLQNLQVDLGKNTFDSKPSHLKKLCINPQDNHEKLNSTLVKDVVPLLRGSLIHDLDVSGNRIGRSGAAALGELFTLTQVRSLDVSGNQIQDEGAHALFAKAQQSPLPLKLNVCGNGITFNSVQMIAETIKSGKVLSLDVGQNNLTFQGMSRVLDAIPGSPLKSLKIPNSKLTVDSARKIAEILGNENQLVRLSLHTFYNSLGFSFWENRIEDEGVNYLAAALPSTHLVLLDLMGNSITDSGFIGLAPSLKTCGLIDLRIGYNKLTDIGLRAITTSLEKSPLQKLSIQGCQITEQGLTSVFPDLEKSSLTFLDVRENRITESWIAKNARLAANEFLEAFRLDSIPPPEDRLKQLVRKLKNKNGQLIIILV